MYLGLKNPCSRSMAHALWESRREGRGYTEKQLRFKGSTVPLCLCALLSLLSIAKLCLICCDPMDCRPPGSSVYGILQARVSEWVAFSSPGNPPDPGMEPTSTTLASRFFTSEPCILLSSAYYSNILFKTVIIISALPWG